VESLAQQCHEYLRDADKKRDELIGFFAVVIGLLFVAYDKLDEQLKTLISIAVALVGVFVALAVIQYRKWHAIYVAGFRVLNDVRQRTATPSGDDILAAWRRLDYPRSYLGMWRMLNPFQGTEAATFLAFLVLSFVPWYLLLRSHPRLISYYAGDDILPFALDFVLYFVLVGFVATLVFYCSIAKPSPFKHWMFEPFRHHGGGDRARAK